MMMFIPIARLQPGMVLSRDVYGMDPKTSRILMLRAGQVLTLRYIAKLQAMHLEGLYIRNGGQYPSPSHFYIKTETRQLLLEQIKTMYGTADQALATLHIETLNQTSSMLSEIIDILLASPGMTVDISNLKLYDDYTYNHSLSVTILSIAIGAALQFSKNLLAELALSALFHDIGKQKIPIEIIQNPGKLTAEEFEIIKKHPRWGEEFMRSAGKLSERILGGILSHHERFNGSGYPAGLTGENIPLFGRVISCADVYDALTSARPYHEPVTAAEAIEYLMGGCGELFDYDVVNAFLHCISPYPVGSFVKLNDGRYAIVASQVPGKPLRPVIRLVEDPDTEIELHRDVTAQSLLITQLCGEDEMNIA